jgi:hypothetical protein
MTRGDYLLLGVIFGYLFIDIPNRRHSMSDHREPWDSDADPGDETDEPGEDFEYTIDFQPDEALTAELNDVQWAMCPRGHVAFLRLSDHAIFCDRCGELYYAQDFAEVFDLPEDPGESPPDEKAA